MKSGWELDRKIATEIFGAKIIESESDFDMTHTDLDECNEDAAWTQCVKRFSADIAAAFQVVEKLRLHGLTVEVHAYPSDRQWLKKQVTGKWELQETPEDVYQCVITFKDFDDDWYVAADCTGSSAPHAICLSAIAAKERIDGLNSLP